MEIHSDLSQPSNERLVNVSNHKFSSDIRVEIAALTDLDNWHALLLVLEDYLIIGLSIASCYLISWYLYPVAVLIIGARHRGLANLLHASVHRTLAKNPLLNFLLGSIFSGYLIFQQVVIYQQSHVLQHHGNFGDSVKDPDYNYHIEAGLYQNLTPTEFRFRYILLPLIGAKVPAYLFYVIRERFWTKVDSDKQTAFVSAIVDKSLFLGQWLLILGMLGYLGLIKEFLLFWIVPYLTSFMILGWFTELSEHYPLIQLSNDTICMSRNRHGNWIERFLTGIHNDHYHQEHHLNPAIPMWNLPKAHQIHIRDSVYSEWDSQWGGIFFSADRNRKTLLYYLMNRLKNMHSQKQMVSPDVSEANLADDSLSRKDYTIR